MHKRGTTTTVCYGTDFVVTASAFYFFYFGVELLQYSAVAGSQQVSTLSKLAFMYALAEI